MVTLFLFLKNILRALWSKCRKTHFILKSILVFQKWTKINVQNSKPNSLFGKEL